MTYLIDRLREPSSYAGLAALLGIFGLQVAPEAWSMVIQVLTGAAGLAAFFFKDRAE